MGEYAGVERSGGNFPGGVYLEPQNKRTAEERNYTVYSWMKELEESENLISVPHGNHRSTNRKRTKSFSHKADFFVMRQKNCRLKSNGLKSMVFSGFHLWILYLWIYGFLFRSPDFEFFKTLFL